MKCKATMGEIMLLFLFLLCLGLALNGIFGSLPDETLRPEGYFSMDPRLTPYEAEHPESAHEMNPSSCTAISFLV